ncbi:MAG: GNAT family N-acetyltransferase [Planctomycetes bacterium]|nr:GNAT family N-acetyltransferase [Planctomycetota bacterium]
MRPTRSFPLVDQYMGIRMGVDLAALEPGRVTVVESPRRLRREQSYGFVHALWFLWLDDGRAVVSVPPGAADGVSRIVSPLRDREGAFGPLLTALLKDAVDAALRDAGLGEIERVLCDADFACNAELLRRHRCGDCRRLTDDSLPIARGLEDYPSHCFPDGIVYGVVDGGRVVSFANAHRPGVMEDRVADLGVITAPGHRRRGYAKTCVSAVVEHITRTGGEARYGCAPDNVASIATARSVGFVPYGVSLVLAAPAPDLED